MFDELIKVLANPIEQIKIVTIVFSTSAAVLIVLLNQWIINKRAKNERFIEKIEEYYAMVSLVDGNLYNEMLHRFYKENLKFDTQCINKSNLLQSLYFPELADEQQALHDATLNFRKYIDYGLHLMVLNAKETQSASFSPPPADYNDKYHDLMFRVNECICIINTKLINISKKYK